MAEFDYEVVDGRKIRVRPQEVVSEIDENGYFVRQPNHFTEGFGEGKNPVEKGRYHLVWAKLCHWSNRASIVRELLGLEDAISVNMVDHAKHEKNLGWEFVYDKDHIDPVLGIQFLSEAYYKADDDYTGRTTVPALIDTKTGKVVNNDYTWLTNYFEVDFKPFHKKGAPDLYQIPAFRHNTYFKDFAASVDLNEADEEYWENTYYDIVVQETDWDTIWKTPTGRESLSKDPAHKFKAEK